MKMFSQAGQDRFVVQMTLGEGLVNGTFLDVGCFHPTELSNTNFLEILGWRGLLVDNDPGAVALCSKKRRSPCILGDATKLDWSTLINAHLKTPNGAIDYLSLDIDGATFDALTAILNAGAVFRIITIEHDAYSRGDLLREPIRKRLQKHDYDLLCADVHHDGLPFEDWFVHPDLVNMDVAEKFRCSGRDWREALHFNFPDKNY